MTTIQIGHAARFTGEQEPHYAAEGRVLRLFEQRGERLATVEFPAADEHAGTDLLTRNVPAAELAPVTARTYPVELTAEQIFGFSDLVRRLTRAYGPDHGHPLRHDLAAALEAFAELLPEPSEADGDAYLDAMDAGTLPNWGADPLPLTETQAEYEAAIVARSKAPVTGRDVLLPVTGTGNVNDDDEESLQFADESEWMDDERTITIIDDEDDDELAPAGDGDAICATPGCGHRERHHFGKPNSAGRRGCTGEFTGSGCKCGNFTSPAAGAER